MADIPDPVEWAKSQRGAGQLCRTCAHPMRRKLEEAHDAGVGARTLSRYVATFCPDEPLNEHSLGNHFANRHAERA